MNTQPPDNLWLRLLRDAVADQTVAEGDHFVDDDDLLDRWEQRELSSQEHTSIVKHLSACSYCAETLTDMIGQGVLQLPAVEEGLESEADANNKASLPDKTSSWRRLLTIGLVAAACVAVVVVLGRGVGDMENRLALVERELLSDPEKALTQLEVMAPKLPSRLQARGETLAERAAYESARARLSASDFRRVGDLESRARRLDAGSGRLSNLRLQAERGMTGELALRNNDHLPAYDYQLNGRNPTKQFGFGGDETTDRWERSLKTAIEEFSAEVSLRLNLGHLLLSIRRVDDAAEQFSDALELDKDNVFAHLGLGLAEFERNEDAKALQHFRDALALDADNFAANLNSAITLERMNQPNAAKAYFKQAQKSATTAELRAKIDDHLSK